MIDYIDNDADAEWGWLRFLRQRLSIMMIDAVDRWSMVDGRWSIVIMMLDNDYVDGVDGIDDDDDDEEDDDDDENRSWWMIDDRWSMLMIDVDDDRW